MAIYSICVLLQDKQNTLVCEMVVPIQDKSHIKITLSCPELGQDLPFACPESGQPNKFQGVLYLFHSSQNS